MTSGTAALLHFAGSEETETAGQNFDGADASPEALEQAAYAGFAAGQGVDLRRKTLAGVGFRGANLSHANLASVDMSDLVGPGLNLSEARLEGANLVRADLVGANLRCVDAGEADFTDALLEDATLESGRLRFASFAGAILDGANLSNADLWGARFSKAAADRVRFHNARLQESSLADAELAGADFTGASLQRADLSNSRLRNAILRDASLDGANLAGADLSGAVLPNLSLASCTLTHARFAGAWLERTRMHARQLNGAVGEEVAGDLQAAIDSYIVLERNFQSLGISEDASWAYLRRRRVGRRLHRETALALWRKQHARAAAVEGIRWLGDTIAQWLCDYGESLPRVARAFVTIWVAFALLYLVTRSLEPVSAPNGMRVWNWVNYLLFSLDSMTTVGTSELLLKPRNELGTVLSSLQTVVGTVLLGLFGFVLGARIRN